MVFIRGKKRELEKWRDIGNKGWGYKEVIKYLKEMEKFERSRDVWRGKGGKLWIRDKVVKENER